MTTGRDGGMPRLWWIAHYIHAPLRRRKLRLYQPLRFSNEKS